MTRQKTLQNDNAALNTQKKRADLTGQVFGKLTVLYHIDDHIQPSGQHKQMVHCICECGSECDVRVSDLKSGNTQSCGCFQQYSRGKSSFEDLTGKRIGRLSVIYRSPDHITPSGQHQRIWHCKCDCGKELDVYATQLKAGKSSCGCLLIETRNNRKLENNQKKAENAKAKRELAAQRRYEKAENIRKQTEERIKAKSLLAEQRRQEISEAKKKQREEKANKSLSNSFPLLAKEWHSDKNGDLFPNTVYCGSSKKVWWLCTQGHEYQQSIVKRVHGGNCPYCSHQKLLAGYNDFATEHPELLSEWDYEKNDVKPNEIMSHTKYKAWWICPFGHSYQAWMTGRCGTNHSGCPICDKENHTSFPEQALFYYVKKSFPDAINADRSTIGLELDIYIPSIRIAIEYDGRIWHQNNEYELKKNQACKENNIVLIRIREKGLILYEDCYCIIRDNVRRNNSLSEVIKQVLYDIDNNLELDVDVDRDAADIYSSYITTRKEHSLKARYPELAKEWHPSKNGLLEPDMVAPNTNKLVWWLGKCGHEWLSSVADRANMRSGCPICSGKRVISGINDLKTFYPELCREWDYEKNASINLYPDKVAPHSDKKAWWKCGVCGFSWPAKIDGRTRMKAGCPKCAKNTISRSKNKPVRCIETKVVYESALHAEQQTGISRSSIGSCCRGKGKTAGKLHWEFVEDLRK